MENIQEIEDSKLTAIINGLEVECDVLFQYTDENTDTLFVGYTDNSTDEQGRLNIYTSKYNPLKPNQLEEITDPKEMDLMKKVIADIINNYK